MKKYVTELSNEEARKFFLQASKFCTIDLPKYFEEDSLGNPPCVKVIREEYHQFDAEGETIETLELQGSALQVTSKIKLKN